MWCSVSVESIIVLQTWNVDTERLWYRFFPVNFSKNSFITEHIWAIASWIEQSYWESENKVRQSTQRNYENWLSMIQKEVKKWRVYLETIEKCYKDDSHKWEWKSCYWGFTYRQLTYLYMKLVLQVHKGKR